MAATVLSTIDSFAYAFVASLLFKINVRTITWLAWSLFQLPS